MDSLKVLDPEGPIREADIVAAATTDAIRVGFRRNGDQSHVRFQGEDLCAARHDRYRLPDQLLAKGPCRADVQPQGDGSLKPMAFEMPQRPEFFMGGGALFSTPRNYMAFLQMLLHEGTFNGAQVLKPETVALMRQNHIGDLNVVTLKTVRPGASNDANLFPGMTQKWGLSFDINTEPGPAGRSAGSLAWAGLFNTYFWIDPNKRVTGTIMTQLLPFADDQVLKLFAKFESGLYAAIA